MPHDIDAVIRARKTAKILADPATCTDLSSEDTATMRAALTEMIETAGWAPFHKVVDKASHREGDMPSPVPWRFYVLEKPACCSVVRFIDAQATAQPDSKWTRANGSKIPKLLAGCSAAVLVTWLPDPSNDPTPEMTTRNVEHIAAASAATQNLLLAAQARGLHSYWSTGGALREPETFAYLGIPRNQQPLGGVFLALPSQPHDENRPGGLRDHRGDPSDWSKWVTIEE